MDNLNKWFSFENFIRGILILLLVSYIYMESSGYRILSACNREKYNPDHSHGPHHK